MHQRHHLMGMPIHLDMNYITNLLKKAFHRITENTFMISLEIKNQYNSKVNELYNLYREMIREPKLPLPPIEYVDNVNYKAQVQFVKCDARKLQISTELILNHSEEFEETMYHEFTHIFDLYILNQLNLYKDCTKSALMLYTEFHAAQIECLKKFNLLDSYGYKVILPLSDKNLCQDIIRFCMDKLRLYIDKRKHFQYIRNKESAKAIKICYMYYLGSSVYLQNLLGKSTHPICFMNHNSKLDLSQVFEILKSLDYYNIPTLEQLIKINVISTVVDTQLKAMFNC